jgi:hypothetical protein
MARKRSLTAPYAAKNLHHVPTTTTENLSTSNVEELNNSFRGCSEEVKVDLDNERHCLYWRAAKQHEASESHYNYEQRCHFRQVNADEEGILKYWGKCSLWKLNARYKCRAEGLKRLDILPY